MSLKCPNCGGQVVYDPKQAKIVCKSCGSPTMVLDRVSKELRPKWIIPFKFTEAQALGCILSL